MASRDIKDLKVEFANKIYKLKDNCLERGVDVLIYCTVRSPVEQAKEFRKGRTYQEIIDKMNHFENIGLLKVADIIEKAGPQKGEKTTNAAPMESWHQYREAVDGVPVENGKALWNNTEQYKIYGEEAKKLGLIWAGDWTSFQEFPHVQLRDFSNPFDVFSTNQILTVLNYFTQ